MDTETNAVQEINSKKESKSRFWKGVLVGVLVTSFAGLILIGTASFMLMMGRIAISGQAPTGYYESGEGRDGEKLDFGKIRRKSELIQELVDACFLYDVDARKVEDGIYKGLLNGLDDPYSTYYNYEELNKLKETTSGQYCGIGAMISQNIETKEVTIVRVFRNSPAEEAGLLKGDILVSANGVEAVDTDLDILVQEQIRGEEHTKTHLKLRRGAEIIEVDVERRNVDVDTVDYQMMKDGKTGYMIVSQFELVTPEQFAEGLTTLEEQGMQQLILDLRGNPGGVLDSAVDMLAYMLPEDQYDGMLVYTEDRNKQGEKFFCRDGEIRTERTDKGMKNPAYPKKDGHEVNIPMVILMDGSSASAAEIFAGAMRDYGRAKLVGMTSFGKGIVQEVYSLGDGSAVKITTQHYYTPSGFDLHGKGLEPDVEVKFELPEDIKENGLTLDNDNQIQKALEVLNAENRN